MYKAAIITQSMKYMLLMLTCIYIAISCTTPVQPDRELNITCGLDSILAATEFPYQSSDTIKIPNGFKQIETDSSIRRFVDMPGIRLYNHSYKKTGNNHVFILIADEEESVSALLFIIRNCMLTDKITIAETSGWEHGSVNTISVISNDSVITNIRYSSSRDWGDYTQWKYDTIVTKYYIDMEGKIKEFN